MIFGKDFFKVLKFVVEIMKPIALIFGDDEDRKNGEDNPVDVPG